MGSIAIPSYGDGEGQLRIGRHRHLDVGVVEFNLEPVIGVVDLHAESAAVIPFRNRLDSTGERCEAQGRNCDRNGD